MAPGVKQNLTGAFADARDRWKIDGQTLKGFYLHSASNQLFCWDQPTGILYEYNQQDGSCVAVWAAVTPQLNAEIWTVLPLPPTDPAALQSAAPQNDNILASDVYILLNITHKDGRQLPLDAIEATIVEFCGALQLRPEAVARLRALPTNGQSYVLQNFRNRGEPDLSRAFNDYLDHLEKKHPKPWGEGLTLRVESTGAILGSVIATFAQLCREDPPDTISGAHCKIMSDKELFFVCDMGTSEVGTILDGFLISEEWVRLQHGSKLEIGPLRLKVELSEIALDAAEKAQGVVQKGPKRRPDGTIVSDDEDAVGGWKRQVWQRTETDGEAEMRRKAAYKERAEARRAREGGGGAIDGLLDKLDKIREQERLAEEAEERRVEFTTQMDQREINVGVDGSFLGHASSGREGIGFRSELGGQQVAPVLDPRTLSARDKAYFQTKSRYEQVEKDQASASSSQGSAGKTAGLGAFTQGAGLESSTAKTKVSFGFSQGAGLGSKAGLGAMGFSEGEGLGANAGLGATGFSQGGGLGAHAGLGAFSGAGLGSRPDDEKSQEPDPNAPPKKIMFKSAGTIGGTGS